jgi:hypothetical protein
VWLELGPTPIENIWNREMLAGLLIVTLFLEKRKKNSI